MLVEENHIAWIALDWGTTHLRAYGLSSTHKILMKSDSDKGMQRLSAGEFEPALLDIIGSWLPIHGRIPVLACGMIGAKQGWKEAGYQTVPCTPVSGQNLTRVSSLDSRIQISIVPGICQFEPADVMRGEETQICGLLNTQAINSACICLPGTHSKWVSIKNGKIDRFSTYMTGEVFALLSSDSILRHSIKSDRWNKKVFIKAVESGFNSPQHLLNSCFTIRAGDVLQTLGDGEAWSQLSGLLIGAELAAAKNYWQHSPVYLIGRSDLTAYYLAALSSFGIESQNYDSHAAILNGLTSVYQHLHNREVV